MSKVVASKGVVGAYTHLGIELGIITFLEMMNSYCVAVQWMEATVVQGRWEERIRLWRANEFVANTKLFVRTPR